MASGTSIPRWKRILGYCLVGFGVLSIIDFFSPIPIPTTFLGAFITGGIAVVAGAWLLTGGGWLAYLKRWAAARDAGAKNPPRARFDPLLPVQILRLAREQEGFLTVSKVAIALNVPLDQAAAALEECVRQGNAFPDYDIDRQHAIYRFPEFIPPRDQLTGDGANN